MYKDCRTCIDLAQCDKHIECSIDGKFSFWVGKITGEILSETREYIYVENHIDNKLYAVNPIDQVAPGFFKISQTTDCA